VSEARGSTTTIKFGKGFNAPWFVATGTVEEQRQQLIDLIGGNPQEMAELTHAALSVKVAQEVQALWAVADPEPETSNGRGRGRAAGTPISPARGGGKSKPKAESTTPAADETKDVWEQAAAGGGQTAQPETPAQDPVLTAIEGAPTLKKLQMIAVQNNAKGNWTDEYKAAASKRKAALEAA